MKTSVDVYSQSEERLNIWTHAFGALASVVAIVALFLKGLSNDDTLQIISTMVYGFSMLVLYLASTFYHAATDIAKRKKLKTLDHIAIYYLIAGTYTPFVLIVLKGELGWVIFAVVWSVAAFGTLLKLKFTGRFKLLSTLLYVAMGWIIIFAINPLVEKLSPEGLQWLMAGGAAYTLGAVLYIFKKIEYTHAIFHVMVLIGSFCHFWAIYHYVI